MSASDIPTTPPPENAPPTPLQMAGSDQWILVSLNMIREDIKAVKVSVDGLDDRLSRVEGKLMRAVYATGGALALIGLIWAGYQALSHFVDITITPKVQQDK